MPETGQLIGEWLMGQASAAMQSPEAQAQMGAMFAQMFDTPEIRALLQAIAETRLVVGQLQQSIARIETTVQELALQVAQVAQMLRLATVQKPLGSAPDGQLAGTGVR